MFGRYTIVVAFAPMAACALAAPAAANTPQPFTLVAIPDTQYETESNPAMFNSETQWILNNRAAQNIVYVTHEGDLTNNASAAQFATAATAMYKLDGVVNYGTVTGNHDVVGSSSANYLAAFGPSHFAGRDWYKASYGASSATVFTGGGRTFMSLNLEYQASADVRNWAKGILASNPYLPTIVTTHDYLDGSKRSTSYGETLWTDVVSQYDQVFMVLCGHVSAGYRQTSTNAFGHSVFEVLADYQATNLGDGYMRLMQFDEANDVIHVKTYSDYDKTTPYLIASNNQFDLAMDFSARLARRPAGLGDFSDDGLVDQADYTTWADNYGHADAALAPGSHNADGAIDQADYTTWADHYGASYRSVSVPEPASLCLLAIGASVMLRRTRRRS